MADNSFLGRGWAFPPEFQVSMSDNVMVANAEDISESLRVILSTTPGERVMNARFGCGINKMVFAEVNNTQFTVMKNLISNAILLFEQRVDLSSIIIEPDDDNIDLVYIRIDYVIRTTNSRGNLVYPFYLNEGTNVPQKLKS